MTTVLDLQVAGSHLFPVSAREVSLFPSTAVVIAKLNKALERERAAKEIKGLSDHMLQDIGLNRHSLNF